MDSQPGRTSPELWEGRLALLQRKGKPLYRVLRLLWSFIFLNLEPCAAPWLIMPVRALHLIVLLICLSSHPQYTFLPKWWGDWYFSSTEGQVLPCTISRLPPISPVLLPLNSHINVMLETEIVSCNPSRENPPSLKPGLGWQGMLGCVTEAVRCPKVFGRQNGKRNDQVAVGG